MTQAWLFLGAAALGAGARVLYFFCALLAKSTRLSFMRYVMDVVFCCVLFAAFALFVLTAAQGRMEGFLLTGVAAGLALGSIPFAAFTKPESETKPQIKKEPQAFDNDP